MKPSARQEEARHSGHGGYGALAGVTKVGKMLPADVGPEDEGIDLLTRLNSIQQQQGFIELSRLEEEAAATSTPCAQAFGVASFYSMLELRAQEITQSGSEGSSDVIRVCDGPVCCLRSSCEKFTKMTGVENAQADVVVRRTSCLGLCDFAPAALVNDRPVSLDGVDSLEEILSLPEVEATKIQRVESAHDDRPLASGHQATSQHYEAVTNARGMKPTEVLEVVHSSGLCGRGGAGFNTSLKWRWVAEADSDRKFIICNADESEPGNFKDRLLLENSPHQLLAGMAICAHAVGALEGVIYVRGEYQRAYHALAQAITDATEAGVLSHHHDDRLRIHLHRGAGAYICGEETALLESLEGRRGEPRSRPPYPTRVGYRGAPTVVNNVETFCAVPYIVTHGGDSYRQLGRGDAAGTKLYTVSGCVVAPGAWELPLGATTRELIACANGIKAGRQFKFAVTGGAAGTFIGENELDVPLGFDAGALGVSLGSGGVMVADDRVSVVGFLAWILGFFEQESCGKCTPCRVGTRQASELVKRIGHGEGKPGDIARLLELAKLLDRTSFCGLGQSVAWPIETAIGRFRNDFEVLGAT